MNGEIMHVLYKDTVIFNFSSIMKLKFHDGRIKTWMKFIGIHSSEQELNLLSFKMV